MKANQTGLKDRILSQIPGYQTALERERRLRTLTLQSLDNLGNGADLESAYYAKVAEAVDGGATDLNSVCDAYVADLNGMRARAEFHQLAVRVMQQARTDADHALTTGSDTALDILRSELDTLVTDVHKHRALIVAHPVNAEQALTTGGPKAASDWKAVTELLGRYDEIHREYTEWVSRQHETHLPTHIPVACGQTRRFLEIEPAWLHRRATTPAPDGSNNHDIAAWLNQHGATDLNPEDMQRNSPWPHAHRPSEWLLIVVDNQPWLPDAATLTACHALADEMFRTAAYSGTSWFYNRLAELTELGASTDLAAPAPTTNQRIATHA
ncbi:hypothetical protein ASE48_20140 [Mycobacterium sp. Root265]|uniref:hypothetical protein n=1 Tax=Mycobacterium sp. Root265 TaxID=1736504 RepID=UPI000709DD33|nr:hypothetical protein [Mycobacterium sp. Root265]KRD04953.1 hypothetical protein ASE48_20140 [Mycobacterium sp. Root265]